MKKLPFPIEIPEGSFPIITQAYGDKSKVAWYKKNGVDINEHNGVDVVVSGGKDATYGARVVCPFPQAALNKTWWDHPMSTKGNGIMISYQDGKDYYQMLVWHCSEIITKSLYKERDIIGFIGNSGLVDPKPTPESPFSGSHIHLMAYLNGKLIDPMEIFTIKEWYTGKDTGAIKDLPALQWVLDYAKSKVEALFKLIFKK